VDALTHRIRCKAFFNQSLERRSYGRAAQAQFARNRLLFQLGAGVVVAADQALPEHFIGVIASVSHRFFSLSLVVEIVFIRIQG